MSEGDQELLKSSTQGMHVDAMVALDGTGHYRTITEAILAAPSHSNKRPLSQAIGISMQGWTTFRTPTVAVSGKGFIARDMTFRNTAGPKTHQAVALRVYSDQSAFYRCSIEGHQDTLYAHSLRQFYRELVAYLRDARKT
uniref:Pectinesterase catalytic domain-containing protein n=1 Tax=Fagus sylvatica TaxID=28930 RepID=A0A2N9JA80_FAGSY